MKPYSASPLHGYFLLLPFYPYMATEPALSNFVCFTGILGLKWGQLVVSGERGKDCWKNRQLVKIIERKTPHPLPAPFLQTLGPFIGNDNVKPSRCYPDAINRVLLTWMEAIHQNWAQTRLFQMYPMSLPTKKLLTLKRFERRYIHTQL